MLKTKLIMALAKVIIAAAWADGEISNEEINSLKDLLFHLPEMTAKDWARLEIYLDEPVGEAERERLMAELQAALVTPADHRLALSSLETVLGADGQVTVKERRVFEEIKAALEEVNVSLLGQLGRLVRGPVQRRSEAASGAPNRERYLQDFLKNKIFYRVQRRMEIDETAFDLPEGELRKLSLAGGLMARVAYVDRQITEDEVEAITEALEESWGLARQHAALVAEEASSAIAKDLDYYRLSRRFFELTAAEERRRFLAVLFAVANADGFVSYEEIEEIRAIATSIKLTHRQFINAKTRIPRDRRAN